MEVNAYRGLARGLLIASLIAGVGAVPRPAHAQASAPVSADTSAATRQLNTASAFQDQGQYPRAAAEWVNFIDTYKTDSRLDRGFYNLGLCYLKSGQHDLARQSFAAILSAFPQSPLLEPAMLYLGLSQYNLAQAGHSAQAGQGQMYHAAIDTFQGFRQRYPASPRMPQALFYEAESYYELGQKAQAIQLYLHLTAHYPRHEILPEALYALGVAQQESDQAAAAGKTFDRFLEEFPKHALVAEVILRRGEMFFALANFPSAAEQFARAAARENFALADQALLRQATALDQLGRGGEAAALYESLPRRFPKSALTARASLFGGKCYFQADQFAKAAALLAQVPKESELWPSAAYLAAESNLQLGRYAEAQKLLEKLIESSPKSPDAPLWKVHHGLTLFLQKQYAQTIAALAPQLPDLKDAPLRAEALYLTGSSRAESGQWPAAVESLQASLEIAPRGRQADDVLFQLARCQRQLNHVTDAQASLRRLVNDFPTSRLAARALFRLAEYHYTDGQFPPAAQAYQELLDRWPQGNLAGRALNGLGWSQLGQRDYAAAERTFTRFVEQFPADPLVPQARYARATARQQLHEFASALEDLQLVLAAQPAGKMPAAEKVADGKAAAAKQIAAGDQASAVDRADARYLLALCQVALNKHREAVATLQALLAESPRYAGADKVLYEMAWAYDALRQPRESAAAFARLASEHPRSPLAAESLFHAAQHAYDQGEFARAAREFAAVAEKAPNAALGENARHKLGWSYYRLDDFSRAAEAFHAQIQAWPTGPLASDAAFLEGECLMKLKRFDQALAAYRRVKKPAGKDFAILALVHGAQAAAELKQWPEGLHLLEEAAQRFPASPYEAEILCEEAAAQQNLGHSEKALQLCRDVLAKTDREPAARAQFIVGQVQFQQKQYADAAQTFFKVAYGYGYPRWQAAATYEAGRCFEALGDRRRARQQYEDLVAKYPQSDRLAPAQARLAELRK